MNHGEPVGTIEALYRYPVKSMRGQAISTGRIWWHGLEGDRRYAFVRGDTASNFPWLTARQIPELICYQPQFVDADDPADSAVQVRTPADATMPIDDPVLQAELAHRYGAPIHLLHLGRGTFDSMALSLFSRATLDQLGHSVPQAHDERRFRPNIVLHTSEPRPFIEETWMDALLTFGDRADSARIRIKRRIVRCMIVNLDPQTAVQAPQVLRQIAQQRDTCAGVYALVDAVGSIAVGDTVYLRSEA